MSHLRTLTQSTVARRVSEGSAVNLPRLRVGLVCFSLVCLALLFAGCSSDPEPINTVYGRHAGKGLTSVNGTSVLARMFQAAGHQVVRRGGTAASIDNVQVIVWAPDNYEPPTAEERELIEQWLSKEPDRTFIYVGRDYDAAAEYWQLASEKAADDQAEERLRREALARSSHDTRRVEIPVEEDVDWFVTRRDYPRRRVERLAGPWSDGIDEQMTSIQLQSHFDVPEEPAAATAAAGSDAEPDKVEEEYDEYYDVDLGIWRRRGWASPELSHEVLLSAAPAGDNNNDDPFDETGGMRAADGSPLVTRVTHPYWNDSALIIVTNGSFLLNMPLVNHEHRKLAGALIDECGDAPLKVAFWDASDFDPSEAIDEENQWAVLTVWPIGFILLHLALLGMIFVLWKFPIFGPARTLPQVAASDFAKHITALGNLMAATGQASYARQRLETYATTVRGESRSPEPEPPSSTGTSSRDGESQTTPVGG